MPAIGFICPDGETIRFEDCLQECRMCDKMETGRCLPKRTLRLMATQREWKGVPSVTQLLNGTRQEYLKIKHDYFFEPQSRAFAIVGTKSHAALEEFIGDDELGEIRLQHRGISGQFDSYYDEILEDTKTYGSYRVAKFLGLRKVYVPTGETFKSGAKKGQPKTKGVITKGPRDCYHEELQLNMYRIMLEDAGFPVKRMNLDIYVRDGGVQVAQSRGVDKLIYYVPVNFLSNEEVLAYFEEKRDQLLFAVEADTLPPPCSDEERWDGMRCQRYCDVCQFCDLGSGGVVFVEDNEDE